MNYDRKLNPSLVALTLLGICTATPCAEAQVEIQNGIVTCGGVAAADGDVMALGQPIAGGVCSTSGSPETCAHAGIVPMFTSTPICFGDANGDNIVNFTDITYVLAHWELTYPGSAGLGDADRNGIVNFADITQVLAHWGRMCG